MNDRPSKPESNIQASLAQWGAAKAVDQAQSMLKPMPRPRPMIWRYRTPLAMAACVVLLITGGLMLHHFNAPPSNTSINQTPLAHQESRYYSRNPQRIPSPALDDNLYAANREVELRLTDQQKKILNLESTLNRAPTAEQVRKLSDQLAQTLSQLKTIEEQVHAQQSLGRKQQAVLDQMQQQQLEQTNTTHNQLASTIRDLKTQAANQREQMQSVNEMVDRITQQMASLKVRQSQYVADLQAMYLASAAPGLHGLASRQAAAREHRMLARLNVLAKQVDDPPTRKLLDQLEVALTYLELMDVNNAPAVDHLTNMLQQTQVAQAIDRTLDSESGDATLRAWLLEARLILAGVAYAG